MGWDGYPSVVGNKDPPIWGEEKGGERMEGEEEGGGEGGVVWVVTRDWAVSDSEDSFMDWIG